MTLSEILRQALSTFRAHKMRTFLTMFGIVWGIASVIILVGLGRGFSVDQKKHMASLGKDLVILWGDAPVHRSADALRDERFISASMMRI